jgi:hypothetical protein
MNPPMHQNQLIYSMFAMVLLTFSVVIRLFRARTKSVREGLIATSFYRLYQGDAEPEDSAKLARHFANLFEAPVLFYVACVAAMSLDITDLSFSILAWVYVISRLIHTSIHTGSNRLRYRIIAYFASWIILLCLWTLLALRVAFSG